MRKLILLTLILNTITIQSNFAYEGLSKNFVKPNNTLRLGKTKLFNQVYFESGVKFSSNADTVGNIHLGLFGLQHQITKKLSVFHSYNFLSQDNYWGNVGQGSYYANFEYKFNNQLKLNLVASFLHSKARVSENAFLGIPHQIFKNDNLLGLITASYNIQKFYFKPLFAYSELNILSEKESQTQSGIDVYYDFKNNDKVVVGLGVYHFTNKNTTSTLIKPYASYTINEELFFSLDYLYANATNFSDQNGYIIYNSVDKTIDRLNASLRYEFANNLFLFGVYQFEQKQYNFTNTNYNFNSLFLGIKYNL